MVKKIILCTGLILSLSCKRNEKPDLKSINSKPKMEKDSTIVGADKDENGCLASAGYTWSKVNKECVQIFNGIGLDPIIKKNDDAINSTYVLFSEDGNLAEVFLAGQDDSMVLSRTVKPNPWVYKEYKLVAKNGYVLEKNGIAIFAGDGEIGTKVINDEPHEEGE